MTYSIPIVRERSWDIRAIVLNYCRGEDTIDCIATLLSAGITRDRLIVVDNHSPDDSVGQIRTAYPDIRMLITEQNLGYTGGMNAGIDEAMMENPTYLFVTNSDVIIDPDAIRTLCQALDQNDGAAVAAPSIYYHNEPNRPWYLGGYLDLMRSTGVSLIVDTERSNNSASIPVTFFSGCSFMITARAILAVGRFDDRYFMYQEDVELSYRLTLHRFTILYVPDARINHKVNDGDIGPMSLYYSMRNRLLFAATRIGGWKKIASMLFLHAMIIAKLFRWSIMRRKLSKALMFAMADYWRGRFHRCTYNALSSSMAVVNSRDLKK